MKVCSSALAITTAILQGGLSSSIYNLSCPLQALDGEGQQEADYLQLKASRRDRVDLLGEEARQPAEDRFDVLADRLA